MMERPKPHEIEIKATWIMSQGTIKLDEVGERIEWLLHNHFIKIGTINSGWNTVFQDPDDNRYWELSYLGSDLHGGGPVLLQHISIEKVKDILERIGVD